jgi:ABC-type transport system involved in cytochrome c biogenesis permease subunit
MVYGVTCFGLLFATVGTILGGIWANYSWGRFWGWDPKENGALLIVLWMILTLHSRMGGYVRDFGFCVLAVVGGTVVAFSWWGVNLLGVGLHSYGFTSGVGTILITLYAVEALVVVSALGWRALSSSGAVEA